MSVAISSVLCLSMPLHEGTAQAAAVTAEDFAKAKQARQLYKDGQYEAAAKIFSGLSNDYPDRPVFTRNLGACYYYLRRPKPAISNLREYLTREKDITQEDRLVVEGWIAEMEKLRDRTDSLPAPAEPPSNAVPGPTLPGSEGIPATRQVLPDSAHQPLDASSGAPVEPASAITTTVAPDANVTGTSPPLPSPGRALRIAGISSAAVGLFSIGTAVYFYTRADSLSDKLSTSESPTASDFKSAKNAVTMQWVFHSAGAALLATGSFLYYWGWRADARAQTAMAPVISPGFAGLLVKGAF